MTKTITLSAVAMLSCSLLQAAELMTSAGDDAGTLTVQVKAMHVVDDRNNGFAPSNGSGYLLTLKYETPNILTEGLKIGVATYINGDMGETTWDQNNAAGGYNKAAYGMVSNLDGESKGLLSELYLSYTHQYFDAKLGRQTLETPLTQIQASLPPNFYEAYMLGTEAVEGLRLTAGHITKMSFGSRAMADAGIIGEGTGTAGVGFGATTFEQLNGPIQQAKFYNIGVAANQKETDGRSVLGATYTGVKNLKVDLWMYRSDDIANDYYAELNYGMPVAEGIKLDMSAQYLAQKDTGDALAGERDFNMMGAKVALGNKKMGAFAAYNQSGDAEGSKGQYFNAWGADPAYTSSLFSRNAYRTDVSAYKVGAHYVITKGLKFMMNYANYGKSKTALPSDATKFALDDATELDTILVYKPSKEWMFKIFNAYRTSEFNGYKSASTATTERRMNHTRVIASYTF